MNYLVIYFLFSGIFGHQSPESHAVYISVSNVTILTKESSLKMSIKVFSNDLEDAIQNYSGKRIRVVGAEDLTSHLMLLQDYIFSKIEVLIDNKNLVLKVVSGENNGDSTWIHLRANFNKSNLESIQIKNQIFMELFDTQTNVVEVEKDGERYFLKLSKSHYQDKINL